MDLELRTDYWDDREARAAFKVFMRQIHGLDFSAWEEAGYWDDAYTPFSYFYEDQVVASVCVYLLDAVVDGRSTHLTQISGVGTLPKWQRKGLNRRLTDVGLEWAQDRQEGVFLFSDTDAVPFYEKCGFQPREEYLELADVDGVARRAGAVKLDCGRRDDRDRIYEYAKRRAPVSDKFSVLNAKLVMFHALYTLCDHAYEIPDLECIIFFARDGGCLRVFDLLGERVPTLDEFYPYIADEQDRLVEIHFHSDKLGLEAIRTIPLLGNHCFVEGLFPVESPVFPFTSRA